MRIGIFNPSPPLRWLSTKYYLLKSGTQVAVTMRNYKRHLGILLSTHWDIREMEMGVFEKEYDQTTGDYYFERKIIKLNPQSIIDLQWIAERIKEQDFAQEAEQGGDKNGDVSREGSGAEDQEQMP